jgi:hypothetical protein
MFASSRPRLAKRRLPTARLIRIVASAMSSRARRAGFNASDAARFSF